MWLIQYIPNLSAKKTQITEGPVGEQGDGVKADKGGSSKRI